MSEDGEKALLEKLDRLQGTRRLDRLLQWLAGVMGTVIALSAIAIGGLVFQMWTGLTEIRGDIKGLRGELRASLDLRDLSLGALNQRLEENLDHDKEQDIIILELRRATGIDFSPRDRQREMLIPSPDRDR